MVRLANFIPTAAIGAVLTLGGFAIYSQVVRKIAYDKKANELVSAVSEARSISAGEDRIWTTQEKRTFLDDLGFREVIGDNQDIYFRVSEFKESPTPFINVIAGYNLENNGRFLEGSSAESGILIGRIEEENLLNYIESNKK